VTFVKCRVEGESGVIMGIYDRSYFQDIFSEEQLKEYMGELGKIRNQNATCTKESNYCEVEGSGQPL
jgi:hypothetical protein